MSLSWPANIPISYESQKKTAPRLLIAKFGDGYEQRTPIHLNNAPRSGTIRVDQPRPIITELENFLISTGGYIPFWFTPPAGTPPYLPAGFPSDDPITQPPPYFGMQPPYSPAGTFLADTGWTITEKGNNYAILEVTIREVFEIV